MNRVTSGAPFFQAERVIFETFVVALDQSVIVQFGFLGGAFAGHDTLSDHREPRRPTDSRGSSATRGQPSGPTVRTMLFDSFG